MSSEGPALRVTVQFDLTASQLIERLPAQYRAKPLPKLPQGDRFCLVVVSTGDEVLRSIGLERALTKAGVDLTARERGTVVVCGYEFTHEARDLLERAGAVACGLSDYGWTDARYAAVHERLSNRPR